MIDENTEGQTLSDAISTSARLAFSHLFREHPEHFYYCALVTTGEAHAPIVSAWSVEALEAIVRQEPDPDRARRELKWSYADSPYCGYGAEFFEPVIELFGERPRLTAQSTDQEWMAEYEARLEAMERAMSRLDSEGLFGTGAERLRMTVLVEVAPPDRTNTERALRLNPREALAEWLSEAGEG